MEEKKPPFIKNPIRLEIFYGNQKVDVRIPEILKSFPGYEQRKDFPVISFLVKEKTTIINPVTGNLESTDPNIKTFQTNFINANSNFNFSEVKSSLRFEGDQIEFVKEDYTLYYSFAGILAVILLSKK